MSAIFGLVNRNHQPVIKQDLELMSAALAHHGPDGGGIWVNGQAGVGQRLRRFTPEDCFEQQPLVSADAQCVLVSDGRIDNRRDLAPELGLSPALLSELPDSTFILRAYEAWREDCVRHLVGSFAFALWDVKRQRLVLARSAITAPALYYYATPNCLAFATMPKGLFALAYIPRVLNEEKLADLLVQSPATPTATLYRDVYRLPTGHTLSIGADGLEIQCHWQPDLKSQIHFPRDQDYLLAFDELLMRAIQDQLRSAAPVGVMLSGGLDSATVAATAARLLKSDGKRLAAFTEVPRPGFDGPVPPGRYADETPFVQAISRMYDNLDLNLIRTGRRTFLDDLDRLFFHLEAPFRNTPNLAWIRAILQESTHQGINLLLDGTFGNLSTSWDGSGLLPELLRKGEWVTAFKEARALARHGAARSTLRAFLGRGIMPFLPAPLWIAATWLRKSPVARLNQPWRAYSSIRPYFAAEQRVDARAHDMGWDFRYRSTADSRQVRYDALASQDIGPYITAFRSLYGVDSRSPLADVRLVEFCLALPEDQWLRDGVTRSILRRAMADRLPREVLSNEKRGLQAADWYEHLTSMRGQIKAELTSLERCDLARHALDLSRMRRLVEQWPEGGWAASQLRAEYGFLLGHGLMVGRFLRWFETGSQEVSGTAAADVAAA